MNAHNTSPTYATADHVQSTNRTVSSTENESRFDKSYLLSIRGILKLASLLFSLVAFICLASTPKCYTNHVFLATVTWLVIIMQALIIVIFCFRLQTKISGIDFEFLDFFATSHDALYLLIASSMTIHFCRVPGQIAGGVMGLFAFVCLLANIASIFLVRRSETTENTDGR